MSEPFDFEAFISGAQLAEDTFALYLVNNGPAIARIEAQIEQANSGGDDREASVPEDVTALQQQVDALKAAVHKSRRDVTLRALTPDELETCTKDDSDVYDQLAMQSVTPVLDRDQWQRLGAAAGAQQFGAFVRKANALATLEVVVPDFSPNTSANLDQRESSLS